MINTEVSSIVKNDINLSRVERDAALSKLESLTDRLRKSSALITLSTLVGILLTFLTISGLTFRLGHYTLFVIIGTQILFSFSAILLALKFDYLRKEGDAYFEELSDELHGARILNQNDNTDSAINSEKRFSLKARVIIRNYSNSSSLPLIPGRYGPGVMVGVNFILGFLTVFFGSWWF
ncbi:MAG: hypothetical protein NTX45_23910 [Proteobacteria bacterium]|nr:hypothetical protein [Pseudomonadota bacterium]